MSNTTWNTTGIAPVDEFLARVADLSCDEWLLIGTFEQILSRKPEWRSTALLLADTIVADRRREMARWFANDSIQTCADLAASGGPGLSRRTRELMAFARQAARRAALALLVRDYLTPRDFEVLYAPVHDVLAHHAAS